MRILVIFAVLTAVVAASPLRAQAGSRIRTDKGGYLAGEPVTIFGEGFLPFESVSLLVTHAGGGAEAGAGHERFFVHADAAGTFKTTWFVDIRDAAGLNFVVAASGSSGSGAQAVFARTARIATDRPSYQPGDRVRIEAEGFNPNELVAFGAANGGHNRELLTALSDGNGRLMVDAILPADNAGGGFTINATSGESGLALSLSTGSFAGRVVYHSYVSYNDGTSQLFILNIATGVLTNISSKWTNLKDPMNAHWSPDGTKIVFMARPKKGGKTSAFYDIFLYTVGQAGNPVNLTATTSLHDEDPKFSPDGSKIVYKVRPSTLKEMDLNGKLLNTIISSSGPERSMPYYTADASAVWFTQHSGADGSTASIHKIDVNGATDSAAVDTLGVLDYYPIRDTLGQFLYTRSLSSTSLFDQVYMFDGAKSVSLLFNTPDADYSDAYPVDSQYVVLSSTKAGGQGGYDLYIADRTSGAVWPMNSYNSGVNTNREELGASYTPVN